MPQMIAFVYNFWSIETEKLMQSVLKVAFEKLQEQK